MMNNNNLDDMLEIAKEEIVTESPKKIPIRIFGVVVGAMIALIIILALSKITIKPQNFVDLTDKSGYMHTKEYNSDGYWDFKYPSTVPTWSKQIFNQSFITERDDTYKALMKFAEGHHDIVAFTISMPSEIGGNWEDAPPAYTNDLNEKIIDGVENQFFSYTLREDYMIAYSNYVHRLINPVFGDWVFAQRYVPSKPLKDNKDLAVLESMFDPEWWETNVVEGKDYTKLPILVDWNGDNFGGLEFAELEPGRFGTWYGIVNTDEENVVLVQNLGRDERGSPILQIKTPIKYSAFGIDDEIIEKTGELELTLMSNPIGHMLNRVVLKDAKLRID